MLIQKLLGIHNLLELPTLLCYHEHSRRRHEHVHNELDGRVHLYLTHSECLSMCRGMRCGPVVELHNVHVMKLSGTPWKVAKL